MDKTDNFPEHMVEYSSKCIFVKSIFWKRIFDSIKMARLTRDDKILDIGCNTGHLLKSIQRKVQCSCWGIDIEKKIMTLKIPNCNFKVADVTKMPFEDNYFDKIFALDTLEHVKNIESAIDEVYRILKPTGFIILSGPTENWFYKICRFLQFQTFEKNKQIDKPGFRRDSDHHFHTVYQIEKRFKNKGFKTIERKILPSRWLPNLFRITKFQKV